MNLGQYFNQTAVFWSAPVPDGWGGFTFASPVEVDVRWTEKQEKFNIDKGTFGGEGLMEEALSNVVILCETDLELKGKMFLGSLTDLSSDQLPESVDALTIMGYSKIPTKLADQFLRKAWLV